MANLFSKSKKNATTKTVKLPVDPQPVPVYDFNTEAADALDSLVTLVGEQAAAEGLHFIAQQCKEDPEFIKMIFDRDRRNKLVGIVQGFNPADILGSIAGKFTGIL